MKDLPIGTDGDTRQVVLAAANVMGPRGIHAVCRMDERAFVWFWGVPLPEFLSENVEEAKTALKIQKNFFIKQKLNGNAGDFRMIEVPCFQTASGIETETGRYFSNTSGLLLSLLPVY